MGTKDLRNNAFTLVELLIVITLLAVLAVIVILSFQNQVLKANDAKRKSDINRIKIAVEEYEKDHNCYPLPQLVVCTNGGKGLQPYLNQIPCDPVTNASYFYDYQNSSCPYWYNFYAKLQYTADPIVTPGIGPSGAFNYVSGSSNAPVGQSVSGSIVHAIGGSNEVPESSNYGCENGVCVQISWDPARPGPVCDPSFQNSNCYGQCGPQTVECKPWR